MKKLKTPGYRDQDRRLFRHLGREPWVLLAILLLPLIVLLLLISVRQCVG